MLRRWTASCSFQESVGGAPSAKTVISRYIDHSSAGGTLASTDVSIIIDRKRFRRPGKTIMHLLPDQLEPYAPFIYGGVAAFVGLIFLGLVWRAFSGRKKPDTSDDIA